MPPKKLTNPLFSPAIKPKILLTDPDVDDAINKANKKSPDLNKSQKKSPPLPFSQT